MNDSNVDFARKLRHGVTVAERHLWDTLRKRQIAGVKFRRQEPIGRYVVDFVTFERKLIIELEGGQHDNAAARKADARRTEWLKSQGFHVIRFWDNDVLQNLEGVFAQIEETLRLMPPHPHPVLPPSRGKEL